MRTQLSAPRAPLSRPAILHYSFSIFSSPSLCIFACDLPPNQVCSHFPHLSRSLFPLPPLSPLSLLSERRPKMTVQRFVGWDKQMLPRGMTISNILMATQNNVIMGHSINEKVWALKRPNESYLYGRNWLKM